MEIQKNKNISELSTLCIGDKAQYYTKASSPEEIKKSVKWAEDKNIPYHIIAGGSNIVFPDKRLKGLLIQIKGGKIIKINDTTLQANSGVKLMNIIKYANNLGLGGLETLAGIPGTIGGAVFGNAGAYGQSISESVKKINAWDKSKDIILSKKECGFKYRHSIFKEKELIITKITLSFKKTDPEKLQQKSNKIIKKRKKKYSLELKCPGSFFKNPLVKNISKKALKNIDKSKIIDGKVPAGWLLDKVGAKGEKQGNIQVADFHGNVLINNGKGTASDIKKLAKRLKNKVYNKFKIRLEEEIRYM